GVEEATVAGDAHHRPLAGQGGSEGLREAAAERAPAERIGELARSRGPEERAEPVARDAHVADHHRVVRERAREGVEELDGVAVALEEFAAYLGVELPQPSRQRVQ